MQPEIDELMYQSAALLMAARKIRQTGHHPHPGSLPVDGDTHSVYSALMAATGDGELSRALMRRMAGMLLLSQTPGVPSAAPSDLTQILEGWEYTKPDADTVAELFETTAALLDAHAGHLTRRADRNRQ